MDYRFCCHTLFIKSFSVLLLLIRLCVTCPPVVWKKLVILSTPWTTKVLVFASKKLPPGNTLGLFSCYSLFWGSTYLFLMSSRYLFSFTKENLQILMSPILSAFHFLLSPFKSSKLYVGLMLAPIWKNNGIKTDTSREIRICSPQCFSAPNLSELQCLGSNCLKEWCNNLCIHSLIVCGTHLKLNCLNKTPNWDDHECCSLAFFLAGS